MTFNIRPTLLAGLCCEGDHTAPPGFLGREKHSQPRLTVSGFEYFGHEWGLKVKWKVNKKKERERPLITYIEYPKISYLLQHLVS